MRDIEKIDAHHHLWDLENNPYPWLQGERGWRTFGDYGDMCRSYLIDEFLADSRPHNVVGSVHVQANWDASDPVGETRWVQRVIDAHGIPNAIVGHAALDANDLEETLGSHRESPAFRGVRHILGHTDDPACSTRPDLIGDAAWQRGYAMLARFGLSFDLQGYPSQLVRMAPVAEANPNVPLVVCHTGFPFDRSPAGIARWREGMGALARLPHCHAKLSGPCMVMRDWTVERFAPFVHETIELFGPARCMFASNVPPDTLAQPYDGIYSAFYAWAARYDDAERRALFHDTAARFYRL